MQIFTEIGEVIGSVRFHETESFDWQKPIKCAAKSGRPVTVTGIVIHDSNVSEISKIIESDGIYKIHDIVKAVALAIADTAHNDR